MPRSRFYNLPLEWKLPLAIGTVLLAVLLAVSWMAYVEVADTAVDSTLDRGEETAKQLATYLGGQAVTDARALAAVAADDALAAHLREPTAASEARALTALSSILTRRTPSYSVELRAADGRVVLAVGPNAESTAQVSLALVSAAGTDAEGGGTTGSFVALNGNVGWPSVAPVEDGAETPGYVVEWRFLTTTQQQYEATLGLFGEGSAFYMGSPGGAWTDQLAIVPPPPVDVSHGGRMRYRRPDSGARLAVVEPVPGTPWFVVIEYSRTAVLAHADAFIRRVLILAGLLFLMSSAVVWVLVSRITGPLRQLTDAAHTLSADDYSPRVQVRGHDEVARLGRAFNHMAQRIEAAHSQLEENVRELKTARERFIHAQRMEAVGQLAAGVAHDFNNLLTVILGEADLASLETVDPSVREPLDEIRRAAQRAATLTGQLLAFSRRQIMEPSTFDLNQLVLDSERMMSRLIGENIRVVTRTRAEPALVYADRSNIEQVIVNLVVNARDAMPQGGELIIETANSFLDEDYVRTRDDVTIGEYIMISVSDTGSGIAPEVLKHVFEPFFTTKEHGRGTGLGLATSYGIVKQLGGHIAAYSEPGVGTTMRVYLPRASQATAPAATDRPSTAAGGNETILLVEDDDMVRRLAVRLLSRQGYRVFDAADAEQGLAILETLNEPVDMLLTDVVLPGMGGRELADRVAGMRPGIRILFASGYNDDVVLRHQLIDREVALIQKPYTAESLGARVREILDTG